MKRPRRFRRLALAGALAALSGPAGAVYVNPDGLGQALIYPYYTTRSSGGNAFNTYVSVVNHTSQAKVVRVRFREALNSRVVQGFNLYLSPNDVWTSALVPNASGGARALTTDTSCTNGPFDTLESEIPGRSFQNALYSGANADGLATGLDRTREGWIEMIEMATLAGNSAVNATHLANGFPANCAALQGDPALTLAAPTGGLTGTLTLINVMSGLDFTLNAEALADLSTQPFYRPPADPYPGFDAAEVTPVSTVAANGQFYRSTWTRGIDAVSAALMRYNVYAEYVLDAATRSKTEFVVTFPTRQFHGAASATPMFDAAGRQAFTRTYFTREERGNTATCSDFLVSDCPMYWSGATNAVALFAGTPATSDYEAIFGSQSRPFPLAPPGAPHAPPEGFRNGWAELLMGGFNPGARLTSLPSSTRIDIATGQSVSGPHVHRGLPVVGFSARTFENGTLSCGFGSCQGNYGGAFPFTYRRLIEAP